MYNLKSEQFKALLLWQKKRGLIFPSNKTDKTPTVDIRSDNETTKTILEQINITKFEGNSSNPKLLYLFKHSTADIILENDEKALFQKMLQAINLDLNHDVLIANYSIELTNEFTSASEYLNNSSPQGIIVNDIETYSLLTGNMENLDWNLVRGKWSKCITTEIPLMATWHPRKLLLHTPLKKDAWEDLQNIARLLKN